MTIRSSYADGWGSQTAMVVAGAAHFLPESSSGSVQKLEMATGSLGSVQKLCVRAFPSLVDF